MAMTAWLSVRRGYPRAAAWPSLARLWADFLPALPALMAPVILIGGMLLGWFTPTEIAAVTVAYALLISALFYRELTWRRLLDAALETLRASSAILLIVAVAAMFGWVLSVEQVPQSMMQLMLSISTDPMMLLLLANLLLLVVGMFLDSATAILVIAPILAKPLVAAGVDPVHLGLVVVFNLMIGLVTPPMGLALFLVADIAKVRMQDVLREMVPYYIPLLATLALITFFPAISLWLPRWAMG
jgi:tripartite ATP-independent transporter DctM subunit